MEPFITKYIKVLVILCLLFANGVQGDVIVKMNQVEKSTLPVDQPSLEVSQLYLSPAQSWETCIENLKIHSEVALFGDSLMRFGGG